MHIHIVYALCSITEISLLEMTTQQKTACIGVCCHYYRGSSVIYDYHQ